MNYQAAWNFGRTVQQFYLRDDLRDFCSEQLVAPLIEKRRVVLKFGFPLSKLMIPVPPFLSLNAELIPDPH